jgi:hypothetical protein
MLTAQLIDRWQSSFECVLPSEAALKVGAPIIVDQNHVAVRVVASAKEHPLITTNPAELYL